MTTIPVPGIKVGLHGLQGMVRQRGLLGALEAFHHDLGDVFRLPLPVEFPVVLVGPDAARYLMVSERDSFRWRMEGEPVTHLLRHGVLVEDGAVHDNLRDAMNPAFHREMLRDYVSAMTRATDRVSATWEAGQLYDMLVECRKIALLAMADSLFGVDFYPELDRLWQGVISAINYISPGPWVVWNRLSSMRYNHHIRQLDAYLYRIIADRRQTDAGGCDMLSGFVRAGLDDDRIRDQLMTMIVAGQDTSTAMLTWSLYLLGKHPEARERATEETRDVLGNKPPDYDSLAKLPYLKSVVNEAMRLYPPIHMGSRRTNVGLDFGGYHIPANTRVFFSIYLTHRDPATWDAPEVFYPERFAPGKRQTPYSYVPFGAGPRSCIGGNFAQVESKVVLARLLQRFDFVLHQPRVWAAMRAVLEPRPGVHMTVTRG